MSALAPIHEAGLTVQVDPTGGLKLRGLSALTPEQRQRIVEYAKANKAEILTALSQAGRPGACESCPAAGYWDYAQYTNQGLLCFNYAYFLGKAGRPKPCSETRSNCPRNFRT